MEDGICKSIHEELFHHQKRVNSVSNYKNILISVSDDMKSNIYNLETRQIIKTIDFYFKVRWFSQF